MSKSSVEFAADAFGQLLRVERLVDQKKKALIEALSNLQDGDLEEYNELTNSMLETDRLIREKKGL